MQTIFYNYAATSGKRHTIDFEWNFVLHFCLGVQFSNYGTTTVTVSTSSVRHNPFEFNHSVLNIYNSMEKCMIHMITGNMLYLHQGSKKWWKEYFVTF